MLSSSCVREFMAADGRSRRPDLWPHTPSDGNKGGAYSRRMCLDSVVSGFAASRSFHSQSRPSARHWLVTPRPLLTHHAIAVPVIHVDVCRMTGVDGGDAVLACLGAGDAAVAVVVIALEGTVASFTRREWGPEARLEPDGSRRRPWTSMRTPSGRLPARLVHAGRW